jgi:asparagine synthase (glutamine-hydrolysing)
MCGILGTYERDITAEYRGDFGRALALLKHRGPDRSRVWHAHRAILGHARLAILDLSTMADQPMHDRTGRYHIVYNGEVYNYDEIRRALEAEGTAFRTDSDTEVVLEAYRRWGARSLERFNGMFALAIYDSREHRLFLARDRYGVKPLYFWCENRQFSFASEMKTLLALGAPRQANWSQISRYVQGWGCDSGSETVYTDIQAVPPGHYVEVAGARFRLAQWWDLRVRRAAVPRRFNDRVARFRELLADAVRLRLRNDVQTGVCLSGGMDSSAVYGLARQLRAAGQVRFATTGQPKSFRVFSVSHPGTAVDEYPWVQKCVQFWGDDEQVSVVRPQPDLLPELINDLIWHQEAPVWSASVLALHIMYRHVAAQGTRVILEGHGGDELLGGYPYLVAAAIDAYAARGDWRRTWQAAHCLAETRNAALDEHAAPAWRLFLGKLPRVPHLRRWLAWHVRRSRSPAHAEPAVSYFAPEISTPRPHGEKLARGSLRAALHAAFTERILPTVLRVVDRATMAYSVESRAPLLDYRVVQFAVSLPDEDLVTRQTKRILRAAVADVIPRSVQRRRAKLGFAIAERDWFAAPVVQRYLMEITGSAAWRACAFLDGRRLRADLERCVRSGFTWHDTTRIWEALNVFLWHEHFLRRPAPSSPVPAGMTA